MGRGVLIHAIRPDAVQPGFVGTEPQPALLVFERAADPQVRRHAWNDVLTWLKTDAVEAHYSGLRGQP